MDKLGKVINGLDCCINHGKETPRLETFVCDFKNCPYEHYVGTSCYRILIKDALELLKSLELQEPKTVQTIGVVGVLDTRFANCPWCGARIHDNESQNYCGHCGQAVKWG